MKENDLLAALCGREADRACSVAFRTRRVVSTSAGVISQQKATRQRSRAMALAAVLVIFFAMGPLIWCAWQALSAARHCFDLSVQMDLFFFFLGGALLASALLIGWLKRRS